MLKRFTLKNYKNFKDEITIDFENIAGYQFNTDCLSDGVIGKMLIYGRNATGKTNLGKALLNIALTMFGIIRYTGNGILLNADSKEDAATFQYEFQFYDTELSYKYSRLSNQELRDEELFINGQNIFKCNFSLREYNFDNLDYIDAETANVERYLQALEADEEDGEWYPDNSDETDVVLAASLCRNNAAKKEKKKKKRKKKEKSTQENNPLKKLFKYDEKKEDDLESEDEEIERRSQSKYHPMYEMAHALEEFCDLKVVDGEVYYYENTYYMHLTKDQIIELYKLRVDPKLHGAVNLRNYRDLYDYIKM